VVKEGCNVGKPLLKKIMYVRIKIYQLGWIIIYPSKGWIKIYPYNVYVDKNISIREVKESGILKYINISIHLD